MLRIRIMTALVIFPVTLALVFLAPPVVFKGAIAILLMAGSHEFARISKLGTNSGRLLVVLQALIFAVLFYAWDIASAHAVALLTAACAAWLLLFIRLPLYHARVEPDNNFRRMGFASALLALTSCWFSLCWLHEQENGIFIVFLLLLIIWASDIGAYFSGKQFGRHKLARVISPNKTWEGVYGGIALALLAAWLWSGPVMQLGIRPMALILITVITTLTSVAGDLFISLHKRTVKLDDAGRLFPGHGGVLDRYDSLLSGAAFFALAFAVLAQ